MTPRFMINPYAQPMLALAAGSKEPDGVQNASGQRAEGTAFIQRSWRVVPRRRGISRQVVAFKLAWPC